MNIFRASYKACRENSREIYKGFGFKHLSDGTQFYVHPDNQSPDGTTTLCQPIGEAITVFADMVSAIGTEKQFGDYFVSPDKSIVYLEMAVPAEYRENGVVESNVFKYRAISEGMSIMLGAYDESGRWLVGDAEQLQPLYKLLPAFMVLLARENETDVPLHALLDSFVNAPVADVFVNLHEDFYQKHKADEYELEYTDIVDFDTSGYKAFSKQYKLVKDNRKKLAKKDEIKRVAFPRNAFTKEQKEFIPHLSKEFVLPENLDSVCSAVAKGDILAVLFHGPAGTGKTMACKLVAQTIKMPIMETINCTENLDEFVLGKYIPQDDKIIFKESFVTNAIRNGGAVVFEEINFAKPQYLAFLNSLLDDNGFVRLDNGEIVKRHKNFRFFATMNLGYFGTKELNQALYNRFNTVVELAALSDEAIARMLITRVPECKSKVDKMLGVYHKLKKKIEAEELDIVISPRNLENWARLAKYEGYQKAVEKTIVPIAKCDRALEDTIRGLTMLYKWD